MQRLPVCGSESKQGGKGYMQWKGLPEVHVGSDAGAQGAGPSLEKMGWGGLPGRGSARLEFCRLGGVSTFPQLLTQMWRQSPNRSPCLWPLPVGAWMTLISALVENSVNCIKMSPVGFLVTVYPGFQVKFLEGFCIDVVGWRLDIRLRWDDPFPSCWNCLRNLFQAFA